MADKPPSATRPLPSGWKESFDETRKRWYFYNPSTKESQWHHPSSSQSERKAVWVEKFDERYKRPYWYNRKTKQSSWTKPPDESLVIKQDSQGSLATASTPIRRKSSSKGSLDVEITKSEGQSESTNKQEENLILNKERGDSVSMLIRAHRKSSGSTESIASPLTSFPSRPDDKRRMVLKAMSLSQLSQGDEKSEDGTSSPSMLPKSPHRKRSVLDPARSLEQSHAASSFNSDRDKAFRHGGLFNKQLLASMQSRSDEDIQISRQPYDRRHYSSKVPSNESLVEPTSPLEAPAERLPVGAAGAEKDPKSIVKPNGARRNSRMRGGGAFASMLNPTGGKKHHVILTSRVGHSTLHQRRKGNRSPMDELHDAFADPLAEGDKRSRPANAQTELHENAAEDATLSGSDAPEKGDDIPSYDHEAKHQLTEENVNAESKEMETNEAVLNVNADSETHDQMHEAQQETLDEPRYNEPELQVYKNYDPLTTSDSENEDGKDQNARDKGSEEEVQHDRETATAEIDQEPFVSVDVNSFNERQTDGENDDPPEISPAERSSDGEDVSVTDNEKDGPAEDILEDIQSEPNNPFDDHLPGGENAETNTNSQEEEEEEEQWVALEDDGQNHELQETEGLINNNGGEEIENDALVEDRYADEAVQEHLEEPKEANEADVDEVTLDESDRFQTVEPVDGLHDLHEEDKAAHAHDDTDDSGNDQDQHNDTSEHGEEHVESLEDETLEEPIENEDSDIVHVQNAFEEEPDSEAVDQSIARRESEDELGVLPGAMEVHDQNIKQTYDAPKNESDDDLEPSIFEREFAAKPGSSDDFRKRLNSVELVQKSQSIRERMEALARRPRPQLSFRKGNSSSSLPRTSSTEDAIRAEQAASLSRGIEPVEEVQLEEPKMAVDNIEDRNPRKHALEPVSSSTSKAPVQVVVEPATKRAAPPVSRGGSVKNLVAKFSSVAGGVGVPIQFAPVAFSSSPYVPETGTSESTNNLDAHSERQVSGESSIEFSNEEIKSALQNSTLVNDAHLTRAAIPRGLRRDPSRRASNFAETLDMNHA